MQDLLGFAAQQERADGAETAAGHHDEGHVVADGAGQHALPDGVCMLGNHFARDALFGSLAADGGQPVADGGILGLKTTGRGLAEVMPMSSPPSCFVRSMAVSIALSLKLDPSVVTSTLTPAMLTS
jgi:hypothetical protein